MQECQSLQHLDQYFSDGIDVKSFIILSLYKTVQIKTQHFCDYTDMPAELEVPLDLDDVFVSRRMVPNNLQDFDLQLKLLIQLSALF